MTNATYGWSTKKVSGGFEWAVAENVARKEPDDNGRYVDTTIINRGITRTRAQASGMAKKVCLSYRRAR